MKKLVLETTAPFQGLPELVAYDEGLFAKEGLTIEWADRDRDTQYKTDVNVASPKDSTTRPLATGVRAACTSRPESRCATRR